eukprot:COSAG06_NODE_5551_length_3406_cov_19.727245_3_plen_43_part_00
MMQEMTRHPRHLGMELVEHKLHLQRRGPRGVERSEMPYILRR